jgi:hypothetical protein
VILIFALVIALPFFALFALLKLLAGEPEAAEEFAVELGEIVDTGLEGYASIDAPPFLRYIFLFLVAVVILLVLWRLFRRLASGDARKAPVAAVAEGRQKLASRSIREIDLLPPADPRQAIRYYYRRFLRYSRRYGLHIGQSQTSRDIGASAASLLRNKEMASAIGNTPPPGNPCTATGIYADAVASLGELREIYLPARYDDSGNPSFSRSDADNAKNASRAIIKAMASRKA